MLDTDYSLHADNYRSTPGQSGEEVIVQFLEGDPDRPIITGRVYNDYCMPPYELPGNKTISGMKSHSSKGGQGFNERRFEDQKGQEQIFVHAEKDQDIRVKHDHFEWTGHQRHLIVKADQLEQVAGDKHLTVQGDNNQKVHGTLSRDIDGNVQERIGGKHGTEAGREIHHKAGLNVVIDAGMSITLKAGGGFITVGPHGVTISGAPVLINSGGAPGSGEGCSPNPPKLPLEADTAVPGQVSRAPPPVQPPAQSALQQSALGARAQPAHQPPPKATPPQGPALNDPVFNPQKGLQFSRLLGPIPAIIAGLLIPDNKIPQQEWSAQGDHYRYNSDDFSLEITHPDGKKDQAFMYPDGTVTDTTGSILGSSDEKGVFTPVTPQEEVGYRTWRANGGQESFAVWKNSGKPVEAGKVSGAVAAKSGAVVGDLKGLTQAEREFVEELASQGKRVEIIPRGPGKTADFLIDGVETELKTINRLGTNTVKNAIQTASRQGEKILIDARGTSLTKADALAQINRAQGNVGGLKRRVTILTGDGPVNF